LKPTIELARTTTPDGQELVLSQHDRDYYICLSGYTLMTSREQESELQLAHLGCHGLPGRKHPHVLIGGLGMGYTLRATLDLLPDQAKVTVAELMPEVIVWNRDFLGGLTNHPLQDPRVVVKNDDVREVIHRSNGRFDAILLDVDNGPNSMTMAENAELYQPAGLHAITQALKKNGCLAIWSVKGDVAFERVLKREKLPYRLIRVQAAKMSKSLSRYIWLIAEHKQGLPRA
jgi:spermidine synthase